MTPRTGRRLAGSPGLGEESAREDETSSERARTATGPAHAHWRLPYTPAIDGLRALAAVAVVGFHARIPGFANGDIGVSVFFALSGFMITSLLLGQAMSTRRVGFKEFYKRRALRLLPAYFAVVTGCVAVEIHS